MKLNTIDFFPRSSPAKKHQSTVTKISFFHLDSTCLDTINILVRLGEKLEPLPLSLFTAWSLLDS